MRIPTPTEAAIGCKASSNNARAMLDSAVCLAADGRYGPASSLAVLALEEAVKARTLGAIVAADAAGRQPGFSEAELRALIYTSHRRRHWAGLFQHMALTSPDTYHKLLLGQAVTIDEPLAELVGLVGSADARKQEGFYTDFNPETGTWTTPADVTQSQFDQITGMAHEFVAETERQVVQLQSLGS